MKRLLLPLALLLPLILSGCGGGGSAATKAHGQVVNQNGLGLAGVVVSLNDAYTATTDGLGSYTFPSLVAGDYTLSAAGGHDGHYLTTSEDVVIAAKTDNNLGTATAYRLLGIGVIVESTGGKALPRPVSPSQKMIEITKAAPGLKPTKGRALTRAASDEFLAGNISFVYLDWEPINTADSYEVYYCAVTGDTKVWDSDDTHLEDPDYTVSSPRAYLDLTNELDELIASAGVYTFKVVAIDAGGSPLLELPVIQVPLGMALESYPGLAETGCLNPTTHVLTWTGVAGASGYKVRVYDSATGKILITDSGETLLAATSYNLSADPNLDHDTVYQCRVDAQYLDTTGWPTEITRGISGFTY